MNTPARAQKILSILDKNYPRSKRYYLKASNPLQLLVATILSAQARDEAVDKITPELFAKYKTAEDFANANLPELSKKISSITFFNNKAKNIKACCAALVENFNSKVPKTMKELVLLPGVGRKTANVVLQKSFGITEGIVVDTHVIRLSQRFGFTKEKNPEKIEKDLMEIFPKENWGDIQFLFKDHGRAICKAPVPICSKCFLFDLCPRVGVGKYN